MYVKQLRPSLGFLGTGEKSFTSVEQGNKGQTFNEETNTKFGNREHKKTNFRFFLGNRGTSQFIAGEQGNRYMYPPGRASE